MRGRCRACQVIDLVHLDVEWFNDVLMNELKVLVADPVFDVALPTREEIVDDNHLSRKGLEKVFPLSAENILYNVNM